MKSKLRREYYWRVRQMMSLKMNNENAIIAINSCAVSLVKYSAGIIKDTENELKFMGQKTLKTMTMNRMYHPQIETDRLLYMTLIPVVSFFSDQEKKDTTGTRVIYFRV